MPCEGGGASGASRGCGRSAWAGRREKRGLARAAYVLLELVVDSLRSRSCPTQASGVCYACSWLLACLDVLLAPRGTPNTTPIRSGTPPSNKLFVAPCARRHRMRSPAPSPPPACTWRSRLPAARPATETPSGVGASSLPFSSQGPGTYLGSRSGYRVPIAGALVRFCGIPGFISRCGSGQPSKDTGRAEPGLVERARGGEACRCLARLAEARRGVRRVVRQRVSERSSLPPSFCRSFWTTGLCSLLLTLVLSCSRTPSCVSDPLPLHPRKRRCTPLSAHWSSSVAPAVRLFCPPPALRTASLTNKPPALPLPSSNTKHISACRPPPPLLNPGP